MKKLLVMMSVAAVLSAAYSTSALADTVRLQGATTVVNVLVNPNRDAVEKSTGHTLEIVGNGSGKGLVALAEGNADASMSSEPLDIVVAAAEIAGKKVDIKTLQLHEVKKDEIVFIVHPANPVSSLTWEQLADIHTGKITNWKQVGGKDLAITVYSDALTGGTRAMVKKVVMGGRDYADSVKSLTAVARVADMVGGDESGVGGLGRGFVNSDKNKVVKTKKLERPLGFVTIGAPTAKVAKVINAFRAAAK